MNNHRLHKLQSQIQNPILIKKKENLLYLTGRVFDYREEGYLLVKKDRMVFFGSGLEKMEGVGNADTFSNVSKYISPKETLEIFGGFTFAEGKYIRHLIKNKKLKIKVEREPLDRLRIIKDAEEIRLIKKSMQIVERVFKEVKKRIISAPTEMQIAQFIERRGRELGAEDMAFPAIVASGPNAAIPHHVPGNKRLKKGESVIIDFGYKYKNYCSDFTRTVFLKTVPKKLEIAYLQAEKAYWGAMDYINNKYHPLRLRQGFGGHAAPSPEQSPGHALGKKGSWAHSPSYNKRGLGGDIKAADIHNTAVSILAEKNLDKYFIHSLGHGTGLEIHELPNLYSKSKDVLRDGMVFSIEPGLYFKNLGGIRIEDLVYMEGGKCKKFINVSTRLEDNIIC